MATQTAAAAAKAKVVAAKQQRIHDVWAARMSIVYKDVRKVSPPVSCSGTQRAEVGSRVPNPGKNTHVSIT